MGTCGLTRGFGGGGETFGGCDGGEEERNWIGSDIRGDIIGGQPNIRSFRTLEVVFRSFRTLEVVFVVCKMKYDTIIIFALYYADVASVGEDSFEVVKKGRCRAPSLALA